ncbi:ammonium transporter [Ancylostoma caninum]|uniref:Ammonium transporter n=1 Tax=Ancylostoma caninum TaxID=29170 RepID=A0A368GHZ5_ANCCA|nr:ammonium transporter [Ancylostoma caninum]
MAFVLKNHLSFVLCIVQALFLEQPYICEGLDPFALFIDLFTKFLKQCSRPMTISGAVAERAKLKSYILLGCLVILIQALPAHWVWDSEGFFYKLGVVDFAGCSAVHMVGGIIGLIATVYLKPRRNRFNEDSVHQMSSPTNALLGTFLLWWGWFGINAGSVWGITSGRWRLGARAAVATIMSSIGGGATSIVISFVKTKKLQVNFLINGILSSIVSITALCAVSRPWHALIIGGVSSAFSISVLPLLDRFKVDDPVGIVPIHLTSSIWGMTAVGIFCEKDRYLVSRIKKMNEIWRNLFLPMF